MDKIINMETIKIVIAQNQNGLIATCSVKTSAGGILL